MIRNATMRDAKAIQNLVNNFARRGDMLSLSLNEIYEKVFEYMVWEENGELLGCCALHPMWEDLAEIRSLAVAEGVHTKGIGRKLVEHALTVAERIGIAKVFALTYVPGFFAKLGFTETDKDTLPKKIWSDCLKCVKFPECDEIAVVRQMQTDK